MANACGTTSALVVPMAYQDSRAPLAGRESGPCLECPVPEERQQDQILFLGVRPQDSTLLSGPLLELMRKAKV